MERTYSATAVDYNRDGAQDVWIGYHNEGGKLWENQGDGTYQRVAPYAWPKFNRSGRPIDRHDCDWGDVDGNGRPDAYCSTGRGLLNNVKHGRDNELWLQDAGGDFSEVGTALGVGDLCGRGRQVTFLHANDDLYPDLFVSNEKPRQVPDDPCDDPRNELPNERSKLFLNKGGTGFRQASEFWPFGSGPGGGCAKVLDFDGDGWDDLLLCRESHQTPRLYRNQAGRGFADVSPAHDLDGRINDAVVADLNGDRDPDVITTDRRGFVFYHPNVGGRLQGGQRIGTLSDGMGQSVAVGDADRDGDLDVYGMAWNGERSNPDDRIWINNRMNFTSIPVPSTGGAADEAIKLNPRSGERAEFLTLNGFGIGDAPMGPIQLIRVTGR